MKCPKCGSEHIGYDDLTIACCTEYHCDWNEFTALTAERDALRDRVAHLESLIRIEACRSCEGVSAALGIGSMFNPVPVLKERLEAAQQARSLLARSEMEASVLRNQVDALAAQLAALKKRVADAERVVALGYVEHSAGKFFLPSHGVDKYGTYALVRLEDGET